MSMLAKLYKLRSKPHEWSRSIITLMRYGLFLYFLGVMRDAHSSTSQQQQQQKLTADRVSERVGQEWNEQQTHKWAVLSAGL